MKKLSVVFARFVLVASVFAFNCLPASAATVLSLINKGVGANQAGEQVNVVDVQCAASSSTPRIIESKVGEREWCSRDIPTKCSRSKIGLASTVCRYGFTAEIEEYQNSLTSEVAIVDTDSLQASDEELSAPIAEQTAEQAENGLEPEDQFTVEELAFEKERIIIEQQKLQLRRQELELNKRRLELERQVTARE